MAFVTADRVSSSSTTTGTGSFTVSSTPPTGYKSFLSVLSAGDTFYYCIDGGTTGEWETGVGTYTSANLFARTTVLGSSAAGTKVSFSAGTKSVFMTLAASATLQTAPATVGASSVLAVATGSSTSRSFATRLADFANVLDFGAVGNGVTDDSAAFTAALAANYTVIVPFRPSGYVVKNIVVSDHHTILFNGSIVNLAAGASYGFKLTGFAPALYDAVFEDNSSVLPNDLAHGFIYVDNATYPTVQNCNFVNQILPIYIGGSVNETKGGIFNNLRFDTFESRGILVGKNVNTCTFSNIRGYCGYSRVIGNKGMPKDNVIGYQQISTGSTVAFGGNILSNVDMEGMGVGFQFTDTNLTNLVNCYGDSVSNAAYQCTGTTYYVNFLGCFAGACRIGFDISGTCSNIFMDGVQTALVGVIPSWASYPADFFVPVGSPAYNISIGNTASATIGSWKCDSTPHASASAGNYIAGSLLYVQSTATVDFDSYDVLYSGSASTVAAASTAYFTANGINSLEAPAFVPPKTGVIFGYAVEVNNAPGAGQTFTYTPRISYADYGTSTTISGASTYGVTSTSVIPFSASNNLSLKIVTSASAVAALHRTAIKIKYLVNQLA
jgi:hypothetical protein